MLPKMSHVDTRDILEEKIIEIYEQLLSTLLEHSPSLNRLPHSISLPIMEANMKLKNAVLGIEEERRLS